MTFPSLKKLADQGERAFIDEAAFFPTSSWKGCSPQ
jgi:hypothetical protein